MNYFFPCNSENPPPPFPSPTPLNTQRSFYILIINDKVLVLCGNWLSKFSSNLHVLRPTESEKKGFYESVCLSRFALCSIYNIEDVNYILLKLINLLLISNEKGNSIYLRICQGTFRTFSWVENFGDTVSR